MMRSLFASMAGIALVATQALAQQEAGMAIPDYYAGAAAPYDAACPDGNCPGGAHGHGLHRQGKHHDGKIAHGHHGGGGHGHGHHGHGKGGYGHLGHRAYPAHWGLAYASGYPNGVANYGNPPGLHDYKGRGLDCRTCSNGECQYRFYGQPDLFYNYYAWPSCTGLGAELYVSPRPVPPVVGHTYITYQPLMPHEFMYHHDRTYHRYYNGGQGLTRTHVHYGTAILPWK